MNEEIASGEKNVEIAGQKILNKLKKRQCSEWTPLPSHWPSLAPSINHSLAFAAPQLCFFSSLNKIKR